MIKWDELKKREYFMYDYLLMSVMKKINKSDGNKKKEIK